MQRFFTPDLVPAVDEVVSLARIHRQLRSVLRAQPGMQLILLDNQGNERVMEVASVDRRDTTARVVEVRPAPVEPATAVTLYQCILKSDKLEWVWQKATELGVTTLVPVISKRTVARPGRSLQIKQPRWEAIVREAAEQSGRGHLPVVAPSVTFTELMATAAGTRLLPWEEAEGNPGLLQALTKSTQPVQSVSLLIGPEGGLEADEVEQAKAAGWQIVSLGKRILRAETAAVTSLSVIMAALGGLGDAPMVKVPDVEKASKKKAAAEKGNTKQESAKPESAKPEAVKTEAVKAEAVEKSTKESVAEKVEKNA